MRMGVGWAGVVGIAASMAWTGQTAGPAEGPWTIARVGPGVVMAEPLRAPGQADARDVENERMKKQMADWAQLGRYGAANKELPVRAAARVVFFGDSITDQWTEAKNAATFFPGKPYVGRGIGGQTTPQMVVRFRQDVIDLHPEAVVILAGTNDIAGNTGPMTQAMTEENLQTMAELGKANGIRVILCSVLPAFDFPWRKGQEPAEKIKALNGWIKDYARKHGLAYVDYWTAMADAKGGMREGLSSDGVHPTAAGYAVMEPLAERAIEGR